jgi:hypothetical protein
MRYGIMTRVNGGECWLKDRRGRVRTFGTIGSATGVLLILPVHMRDVSRIAQRQEVKR